jgi:MvaI/BcnI restriction endonuclease family
MLPCSTVCRNSPYHMAASVQRRIAFGERAGQKGRRLGSGFGYEGEAPTLTGTRCASRQALMYKAGNKLKNSFYVLADNKWEDGHEFLHFSEVDILSGFNFEGFLNCIEDGTILIDFDARTGHNHGTKFRIRQNNWPRLYTSKERVV